METMVREQEYINNVRFELGTNANGQPTAKQFIKARNARGEKQIAFYRFPTEQARQNWLDVQAKQAADRMESAAKAKAFRDEARAAFVNPFKVGEILVASWGYEQTNIDWYQITATTPKSVKFRKVCGNETPGEGLSPMAGYTVPCIGEFVKNVPEESRTVQIYTYNGQPRYSISYDGHSLNLWDGKPEYASHYA